MARMSAFVVRVVRGVRRRLESLSQPVLLDDARHRFNAEHSGGA